MNKVQFTGLLFLSTTLIFTACKKPEINNPQPVEQELITTVRLIVTNGSGFNKTFNYKVEHGFNGSKPSTLTIDSILLAPATEYDVEIQVLDEAATPAKNITEEVIAESHHHLFLVQSNPLTGAGSIDFHDGSKDDEGGVFNQKGHFKTGAAGHGTLTVTLKHEPANKSATTPDEAGGETDAQAMFPVKLM